MSPDPPPEPSERPPPLPAADDALSSAVASSEPPQHTLDPADWEEFRALGHRMFDDMVDYLATLRERPPWQPVPKGVRERLAADPLPRVGQDAAKTYAQFKRDILPFPTGNLHPRFWGWVRGTGTPLAMVAEMLAAGMNCHVAGMDQSAALVERQVIRWLAEIMGFPPETSGLLTSGATAANLLGLAVARQARAGYDVRAEGLQGGGGGNGKDADESPREPLVVYGSKELHSWAQKTCELLGLGNRALRRVAVGSDYRMDLDALRRAVAADRAAGHRPICVVGTVGTVNTGATDPLDALADFCAEEGLWFHVDGAFGALAALSPSLRPQLRGLERADSLGFDLHKWGYLPYEVGCALVRDPVAHRAAFSLAPDYLKPTDRGLAVESLAFADLGIQLSRGFRALKVWMSLKTHGADGWARLIEQNVAQVRYLAELVEQNPRLELLAPVPLNVVCFRYLAPGLEDGPVLDALNREILLRVQERGVAVLSSTVLDGRWALRVAHTNHRSRREDFDALVAAVVAEGDTLRDGGGGGSSSGNPEFL